MPATYLIGLLLLLQAAGCTVTRTAPAGGPLQGGTVVVERLPPAAAQDQPGVAETPQKADGPGGTVIIERLPPLPEVVPEVPVAAPAPVTAAPVTAKPSAAAVPGTPVAATDKPAVKAPAKVAALPPRAPQPQKLQTPSAAAPATQAPSLALAALEQRLKDTDAIGLFTKIALKNQIDDLLNRFKAYFAGGGNTTLAQLRQFYDQLLLKAHGLLKDGDPALANAIMGSREAIWGVLTDPVRFAKL